MLVASVVGGDLARRLTSRFTSVATPQRQPRAHTQLDRVPRTVARKRATPMIMVATVSLDTPRIDKLGTTASVEGEALGASVHGG